MKMNISFTFREDTMKKALLNLIFVCVVIALALPDASQAQGPVRKKRSEELTKSAINLYKADKMAEAKDNLLRAVTLDGQNVLAHEML
jgi:Tfp pilus assembly protein PilF